MIIEIYKNKIILTDNDGCIFLNMQDVETKRYNYILCVYKNNTYYCYIDLRQFNEIKELKE